MKAAGWAVGAVGSQTTLADLVAGTTAEVGSARAVVGLALLGPRASEKAVVPSIGRQARMGAAEVKVAEVALPLDERWCCGTALSDRAVQQTRRPGRRILGCSSGKQSFRHRFGTYPRHNWSTCLDRAPAAPCPAGIACG